MTNPIPDVIYIVGQEALEYDDQYYYSTESGGMLPSNVYLTHDEAKKGLRALEVELIKHYTLEDLIREDDERSILEELHEKIGLTITDSVLHQGLAFLAPKDVPTVLEVTGFSLASISTIVTPDWIRDLLKNKYSNNSTL